MTSKKTELSISGQTFEGLKQVAIQTRRQELSDQIAADQERLVYDNSGSMPVMLSGGTAK